MDTRREGEVTSCELVPLPIDASRQIFLHVISKVGVIVG
jgi:hypothetical protein